LFLFFCYNDNMIRSAKRATIIVVYLTFFFLLGWMIYSIITPNPTCVDRKKNQGEEKADCGGPCNPCEKPIEASELIIQEKNIIDGGSDIINGIEVKKYDVVVRVKNPNESFGSPAFNYLIVLKDNSGNTLSERKGSEFIYPMEVKNLIENNLEAKAEPKEAEVKIIKTEWIEFENYQKPRFSVYNKKFNLISSGTGYCEVIGTVFNESKMGFGSVRVKVILKDFQGNPIAANKTEIRDLRTREEREFKLFWPSRFPGEVNGENIETTAESNVFDSENLKIL